MKKLICILMMMPSLCWAVQWETCIRTGFGERDVYRIKVPHGWIITLDGYANVAYYPDENNEWRC